MWRGDYRPRAGVKVVELLKAPFMKLRAGPNYASRATSFKGTISILVPPLFDQFMLAATIQKVIPAELKHRLRANSKTTFSR